MTAEADLKPEGTSSFWTLERKLPLLVSALIAATIVLGIVLSYHAVLRAGREAAVQRLNALNQQFSAETGGDFAQAMAIVEQLASNPTLRVYVENPADADREQTLEVVRAAASRLGVPAQLRTAEGIPLIASGGGDSAAVPRFRGVSTSGVSTIQIEQNRGAFWIAAPVRSDGRTIGWLTFFAWLQMQGATGTLGLIGEGSTIVFTNRDASVWVDSGGAPIGRPTDGPIASGSVFRYRDAADVERLIRIDSIPNTPWMFGLALPLAEIDRAAHRFLSLSIVTGTLLTLLGALAAWMLSQRITAPIKRLRSAALAIASGEYTRRVPETRNDEIGDLARTFNMMTSHIQASHEELENRYEHAQALAMELEMANQELEESIAETDAMRQRAQEANRAKSEFLATMSHEIRTPINAIVGYADLLELGIGGEIAPEQLAFLQRIKASGAHLTRLVDEVLDFAKIEAGQLRVIEVVGGARRAIERAVATIEPAAREKGITIRYAPIPEASYRGDPQRVVQILLNLLSNGVKFTPAGGWVEIGCEEGAVPLPGEPELHPGRRYVRVSVTDSGVGIPENRFEEIFEPFVQGESGYTRQHGGTGLGLSISRRLARMMGGEVTAERREGGGSIFSLWLREATEVDREQGRNDRDQMHSDHASVGAGNE